MMYLRAGVSNVSQGDGSQQDVVGADDLLEPIRPANAKAEGGIHVTSGISGEIRGNGEPGSHFTQGGHDHVDIETDEKIPNKDRPGSRVGEGRAAVLNAISVLVAPSRATAWHDWNVRQPSASRIGIRDSRCNDQTCANGATDCDHANVTRLQPAVQRLSRIGLHGRAGLEIPLPEFVLLGHGLEVAMLVVGAGHAVILRGYSRYALLGVKTVLAVMAVVQ